jgi:hypothetical protein
MATVLLFDDDILFKAVEGSCLRRERCRILKTPPSGAVAAARKSCPDLVIASSATPLKDLGAMFKDARLRRTPIVVLDFGLPGRRGGLTAMSRTARRERPGPIEILPVPTDAAGRMDLASLDRRLDAALEGLLPDVSHRTDRVAVSLAVECRGRGFARTLRTKNISPTGLFLKTDVRLSPGRKLRIRFRLPAAAAAAGRGQGVAARRGPGDAAITGDCVVVRRVDAARDERGSALDRDLIPGVGVRFVALEAESRTALGRFVRVAGARQPGSGPAH